MVSSNLNIYMPIIILIILGVLMVTFTLLIGKLIRPKKPSSLKSLAYECGEEPQGDAWTNFNVRFYVVSLVFIIFDVEAALIFPVAVVFKKFNQIGEGGALLGSLFLFITILVGGVVYCWSKGDFDWVKSYRGQKFKD